jgi:hypothetical protein
MYTIKTENWIYEVVNCQRKDYLYDVYVHKTSKVTRAYAGESLYSVGVKEPIMNLDRSDVSILDYTIL